jgi:hypothetical protein
MIYNIPDISRKYIPGEKKINRIRTKGKYAYLACSFGIVVVDLVQKGRFWIPGNQVRESEDVPKYGILHSETIKYMQQRITGVYSADLTNQGLSYFGNWKLVTPSSQTRWQNIPY